MPYKSIQDLPEQTKALPKRAKEVFLEVFNNAIKEGKSEDYAFPIAWTAVNNGWKKVGEKWLRKTESSMKIKVKANDRLSTIANEIPTIKPFKDYTFANYNVEKVMKINIVAAGTNYDNKISKLSEKSRSSLVVGQISDEHKKLLKRWTNTKGGDVQLGALDQFWSQQEHIRSFAYRGLLLDKASVLIQLLTKEIRTKHYRSWSKDPNIAIRFMEWDRKFSCIGATTVKGVDVENVLKKYKLLGKGYFQQYEIVAKHEVSKSNIVCVSISKPNIKESELFQNLGFDCKPNEYNIFFKDGNAWEKLYLKPELLKRSLIQFGPIWDMIRERLEKYS